MKLLPNRARMRDLLSRVFGLPSGLRTAKQVWQDQAQPGELAFHRGNQWRNSDAFAVDNASLLEHFGFSTTDFEGKTILDLGAGSRLRSAYFKDADVVVIEPLADQFRRDIEWCDLSLSSEVYSLPAEEFVPGLTDRVHFVLSINVLDHCYDFFRVMTNVYAYLRKGGTTFLSFDAHGQADQLHPLRLNREDATRTFLNVGFTIEQVSEGLGPMGRNYGHGSALNFWLRKS